MKTDHTPAQVDFVDTTEQHIASFARKRPMENVTERLLFQSGNTSLISRHSEREVFSYDSPRLGPFAVDVTGLKEGIAKRAVPFNMYRMTLSEEWVTKTIEHNGCDEAHISRIDPGDLEYPGIALMLAPDGDVVMIDGNHRLVRRWREGMTTFFFAMVTLPDALPYLAADPSEFGERIFA